MEVFTLENLINTVKNFDTKIKKLLINGLYFSFFIALVATLILIYYISFSPSNFIYYIGIKVMHLAISFGVSFFVSALAIDKIKRDLE